MKEFTIREFKRIGLTRVPGLDFTDDGTSFRCWTYKNLRISYAKSNDTYFIAVRLRWNDYSFTVQDALNEKWYNLTDEFNGCKNPDADKLLENLEIIHNGIEDLEKRISKEKIDVMDLCKAYSRDLRRAEDTMEKFRNDFDWIHANEWDRKSSTEAYRKLETLINKDVPNYKKLSYRDQRQLQERIRNYNYIDYELHVYTEDLLKVLAK